jgi:hypothetical protein
MVDRFVFALTTALFTAGWFGALQLQHISGSAAGFGVWAVTLTAWLATRAGIKANRRARGIA